MVDIFCMANYFTISKKWSFSVSPSFTQIDYGMVKLKYANDNSIQLCFKDPITCSYREQTIALFCETKSVFYHVVDGDSHGNKAFLAFLISSLSQQLNFCIFIFVNYIYTILFSTFITVSFYDCCGERYLPT